jgi:hypothetical protein
MPNIFFKEFIILHQQLLNQQLQAQAKLNAVYNSLPVDIRSVLDDMAYGISVQENIDSMTIKTKMVNNINKLPQQRAEYLVSNMAILIDKSLNQGEAIDDKNTQKEFISFLISLYF